MTERERIEMEIDTILNEEMEQIENHEDKMAMYRHIEALWKYHDSLPCEE